MNYCTIDEAWQPSSNMKLLMNNVQRNQQLQQKYYNGLQEQENAMNDQYQHITPNDIIHPMQSNEMIQIRSNHEGAISTNQMGISKPIYEQFDTYFQNNMIQPQQSGIKHMVQPETNIIENFDQNQYNQSNHQMKEYSDSEFHNPYRNSSEKNKRFKPKKVTFNETSEIIEEHFTPDIEVEHNNCEDIIKHLNDCKLCKSRVKEHFGTTNTEPTLINKYLDKEMKQILIIILIGLFIVILLDLFFSLGKNITFKRY